MSDMKCGCGCGGSGGCCAINPSVFVRMRYFYGQRLGVVDFQDEQSYHSGKQRFHNHLLHGSGVVCGLNVERFVHPQGSPPSTKTTVLRVTRGTAIDACGREIVVGTDQCIDVNAWFQANRTRPDLTEHDFATPATLFVIVKYRDCPSDPAPAPRDPCGCTSGGCEYGRFMESFQLLLVTREELGRCLSMPQPSTTALDDMLAAPFTLPNVETALQSLLAHKCPDGSADTCLALARIEIAFTDGLVVDDITSVHIDIPERAILMPTQLLQRFGSDPVAAALASGGPRISSIRFEGAGTDAGHIVVEFALGHSGSPPTDTRLADPTFAGIWFLSELDPEAGWKPVTFTESLVDNVLTLYCSAGTLTEDRHYRFGLETRADSPAVDVRMRPLTPQRFATHFRLAVESGTLAVQNDLF